MIIVIVCFSRYHQSEFFADQTVEEKLIHHHREQRHHFHVKRRETVGQQYAAGAQTRHDHDVHDVHEEYQVEVRFEIFEISVK